MIGSLRGRVLERDPVLTGPSLPEVLIEVAGVGYRVSVTAATLDRMAIGGELLVYIHHHIRESDQRLYGFLTKDERVAFEGLLAAHGVGPSLAMAVLATHSASDLVQILATDDLAALCEVPGVGKKTAQRLLVELKSSLVLPEIDAVSNGAGLGAASASGMVSPLVDVREALVNLGYSSEEIRTAIGSLPKELVSIDLGGAGASDPPDSGRLLKLALQALAGD